MPYLYCPDHPSRPGAEVPGNAAVGLGDRCGSSIGGEALRQALYRRLFVEGRKSLEGTYHVRGILYRDYYSLSCPQRPPGTAMPTAAVTALVCGGGAVHEERMDTITCPLAVVSVLVPLMCREVIR